MSGQNDAVFNTVAESLKSNAPEAVFETFGALHGPTFNLFKYLNAAVDQALSKALHFILPAVSRTTEFGLEDGLALLRFANRVPSSSRHAVAEQLCQQFKRLPQRTIGLGQSFDDGIVDGEGAIRVWAGAFAMASPVEAANYVLDIIDKSERGAAAAVNLMAFLDCKDPAVAAVFEPQASALTQSLARLAQAMPNEQMAWSALCATAEFSTDAMSVLQEVLRVGPVEGIACIAMWLERSSSAKVGASQTPIGDLLGPLLEHVVKYRQLCSVIDSLFSTFLYRSATRPAAEAAIVRLGEFDLDPSEEFPRLLSTLAGHPTQFSFILTKWLTTAGISLNAIRALLSQCIVGHAQVSLDVAVFNAAPDSGKALVVRRLLALTHDGPVICRFLTVLAETPALQPGGLLIAAEMLNYVFVEYPGATEEFLKVRTRPDARGTPFAHVYRGVYANALRWKRVVKQLPEAKELRPSESQLFAMRMVRARENRDILRAASEKSVFAQIATKLHIKQGRRFASHTRYGAPQISEMTQLGSSIELPSSELADPVGGMLTRARMLGDSK